MMLETRMVFLREDVFPVDCTRHLGVVVMLPPRMSCWPCTMHVSCTHHLLNNHLLLAITRVDGVSAVATLSGAKSWNI